MIFRRNRKRQELQRRRRKYRLLGVFFMLLLMGYFGFELLFSERGLLTYSQVVKTHRQILDETRRLERQNEQLRHEVHELRNDSVRIEAIARQELGLAKKGELIYLFKRDDEK